MPDKLDFVEYKDAESILLDELKYYIPLNYAFNSRHNYALVSMLGQGRGWGVSNFCSLNISSKAIEGEGEGEVVQSCPTLCNPIALSPTRPLCPWDPPGKNTGVGWHFLLQKPLREQDNLVQFMLLCQSLASAHLPRYKELLLRLAKITD